jgi:RNA polymerase sigma factor (sigma-70 family)
MAKEKLAPDDILQPAGAAEFAQLLQAARAGSRAALGRLLEAFRPVLSLGARHMAERLERPRLEPDDLVQETMTAAVEHIGACVAQTPGQVRCWLRRILCRKLADQLRRWRRWSTRDVSGEVPVEALDEALHVPDEAAGELEHAEDCARVQQAVKMLRPSHREIIVARIWQKRTFRAIAAETGRFEPALRQLYRRALSALEGIFRDGF